MVHPKVEEFEELYDQIEWKSHEDYKVKRFDAKKKFIEENISDLPVLISFLERWWVYARVTETNSFQILDSLTGNRETVGFILSFFPDADIYTNTEDQRCKCSNCGHIFHRHEQTTTCKCLKWHCPKCMEIILFESATTDPRIKEFMNEDGVVGIIIGKNKEGKELINLNCFEDIDTRKFVGHWIQPVTRKVYCEYDRNHYFWENAIC